MQVRIISNNGRADEAETTERLRGLARSILRRCALEEIIAENSSWQLLNSRSYGDVYVLERLWWRFDVWEALRALLGGRKFDFYVERMLVPSRKLHRWDQWLAEDVCIEGTQAPKPQHQYRATDYLEANREAIERAIYFRMADLLNLDVEIVFYDTTSLHLEVDEADHGIGEIDQVRGNALAGKKTYRALRKRWHSKNGRFDAPQVVIGLAVTRDGFPVRYWIFLDNTADVTTVKKVNEDLKGWQLNHCIFVGTPAWSVRRIFPRSLARSGGKSIVCMPIHRGSEVATEVATRPGRYQRVAENLQVKEVIVGDGERRRHYVVYHNAGKANGRSVIAKKKFSRSAALRSRACAIGCPAHRI